MGGGRVDFFYMTLLSPFGKLSILKNIHLYHLINSYSLTSKNAQSWLGWEQQYLRYASTIPYPEMEKKT